MPGNYEWWTDPSGGRHFGRVFPKAKKADAPVEVATVEVASEPVAVVRDDTVKAAPKKRAPAKKKSNG